MEERERKEERKKTKKQNKLRTVNERQEASFTPSLCPMFSLAA
jgi:hypothetical protein